MSEAVSGRTRTRQRLMLVGIVLLFASPIMAAWVAWQIIQHRSPPSTVNHGELIQPARPLSDFRLHDLSGKPYTLKDLRGKWTLVYLGAADCDAACRNMLYKMRQARLAQGGEMNRVARLYIIAGPPATDANSQAAEAPEPDASLRLALKDYAGTIVVTGSPSALAVVRAQFMEAAPDGARFAHGPWLYLVDPLGNLMMRYPADFAGPDLVKDLERLLRISQIG